MAGMLTVTLRRSMIGEKPKTGLVVAGLGLGKMNSSRVLPDNPSVRGAVHRVRHLVEVTEDVATSVPAIKRAARKTAPRKTAAEKTAAKKAAAKRAAAKRAAARIPVAKKAAAKKAPAKMSAPAKKVAASRKPQPRSRRRRSRPADLPEESSYDRPTATTRFET